MDSDEIMNNHVYIKIEEPNTDFVKLLDPNEAVDNFTPAEIKPNIVESCSEIKVENHFIDEEDHHIKEDLEAETTDEVCCICKSEEGDPLKLFVPKTWGSFKSAAKSRCLLKKDRYRGTSIEVNLKQEMGSAKYHSKCYQNYTAVKRSSTDTQSKKASRKLKTQRSCEVSSSNTTDLLKGFCIFCLVKRKTIKRKVEPLSDCNTPDGNKAIIDAAPRSKNERLKAIVSPGIDLIAKEAQYHKSCHRKFFHEIKYVPKTSYSSIRYLHTTTFQAISDIIELQIIERGRSMFCASLLELYRKEFLRIGGTKEDFKSYTIQNLMNKVKDKFGERISVSLYDQRKGNFLYKVDMSEVDARENLNDVQKHLQTIESAALSLRSAILEMPEWGTQSPTTVEELNAWSPEIPEELLLFYKTLLCGIHEPSDIANREAINRKVTAMASDAACCLRHIKRDCTALEAHSNVIRNDNIDWL
ncbi:unnamed protein product [Meganyctiphanes norvegica]|uniref:Uncharacterized protein n=1 Tax=Meganyctiphanes norvegica TaxID=48144 RepID=A0AAV2PP27_MEGNR